MKKDIPPPPLDTSQQMSVYIPVGPKYFAWFASGPFTHQMSYGIYLLELNRQKRIASAQFHKMSFTAATAVQKSLFYGTILYGTWIAKEKQFVAEDIYYWKGQNVSICYEKDKWHMICALFEILLPSIQGSLDFGFRIPPINQLLDPIQVSHGGFHHVQFRNLQHRSSYVNYIMKLGGATGFHKTTAATAVSVVGGGDSAALAAATTTVAVPWQSTQQRNVVFEKAYFKTVKKPQYLQETVFRVVWDSTGNDLYKLYAYGPGKSFVFYDYACVQDTQTSYEMKQLFGSSTRGYLRKDNIDYLEESDSEEEGAGRAAPQVVVAAAVLIRCRFHMPFKKWLPMGKAQAASRVVHISHL